MKSLHDQFDDVIILLWAGKSNNTFKKYKQQTDDD